MEVKQKGKIKWFHNVKGYGFISGSDGKEYFLHYTKVMGDGRKEFETNESVRFFPFKGLRGLEAREVIKGE